MVETDQRKECGYEGEIKKGVADKEPFTEGCASFLPRASRPT